MSILVVTLMMIGLEINLIPIVVVQAYDDDHDSSSSSNSFSTTSSIFPPLSLSEQFPHPFSDGLKIPCKVRKLMKSPKLYFCSAKCSAKCYIHHRRSPKFGTCVSGCVEYQCVGRQSNLFACTFGCTKSIVTKFGLYDHMDRMEGYMTICYNNCREN